MSLSKNVRSLLFFLTLFNASCVYGEINDDNYTSEELLSENALDGEGSPFSFDLSVEWTGHSKFEHDKCKIPLHHLQFGMIELDMSAIFYYNPYCKEGLLVTGAYTYTKIQWENPFFRQNHFDTVSLALGGFTERVENWLWKGEVRLNADVDYFNANDNLYWNLIFAGRYSYSEASGIHMGLIAFTGMKIDRLYPILGVDWIINPSWKLNLVYPTDISLVYTFDQQWSFDLAARGFDERHRVGKSYLPEWEKGLIEYRAAGVEARVNFKTCDDNLLANIHIGEIIGGRLKVSTKGHHNIKRYNFKNAPYIGGEIAGKF